MKWLFILAFTASATLTYLDAKQSDELVMHQARYCKMVQLYKDSNGENGWPDYNENAAEVCHE